MSNNNTARSSSRRTPLGEATVRVNNSQHPMVSHSFKSAMPRYPSRDSNGLPFDPSAMPAPLRFSSGRTPASAAPTNRRMSELINGGDAGSKRDSQASNSSANSKSGIKIQVGPWNLGKTLGQGSTARVRLAKHVATGRMAAVKIIQKNNAKLGQAGSLADFEKAELVMPQIEGLRRMPISIEREVAIMSLIKHPHITELYDIWENHSEIYMILEYMGKGELFHHISDNGRLHEEEALKYFRQILSALGYCHSFNICHRDLKPENILVNAEGDVKIADFGMAALQQGPDYRLQTSCGSPHYAAPEIIRGAKYRGNQVDIWSTGVILYAMLVGKLPFDTPDRGMASLTAAIRLGKYDRAPSELSNAAVDLIQRMLTVNPKDRITVTQIWRHPLVQAYDYLDDLGHGTFPQSPSAKDYSHPVSRRHDIDEYIVRQLRSMWHTLNEQEIIRALLNDEPNDQKLFYTLLLRDRATQLENYVPDLDYSGSDYHHVRPVRLTKTHSTMKFPSQSQSLGQACQGSKFTVISNTAETERSYDPFKASRPQRLNISSKAGAKITIHPIKEEYTPSKEVQHLYPAKHLAPPRYYSTRSSLASTIRSTSGSRGVRPAMKYKRGVSFNHTRSWNSSILSSRTGFPGPALRHSSNYTEVTDDGGDMLRVVPTTPPSTHYVRSKKPARTSLLWGDDVRKLSSNLAKDCDEAFNIPIAESIVDVKTYNKRSHRPSTSKHNALDDRPLPPAPARTESVKHELKQQKRQYELRKELEGHSANGHLDRMVTHLDELLLSPEVGERRTSSAPLQSRTMSHQLPSIHEDGFASPERSKAYPSRYRRHEIKTSRVASAPESRETGRVYQHDRYGRGDSTFKDKDTIRVVSNSTYSPVTHPTTLAVRRKSSHMNNTQNFLDASSEWESSYGDYQPSRTNLRYQYNIGGDEVISALAPIAESSYDEEDYNNSNQVSSNGTVVRKKSGWFRRGSRISDDTPGSSNNVNSQHASKLSHDSQKSWSSDGTPQAQGVAQQQDQQGKKKGIFGKLFNKKSKADSMAVAEFDVYEDVDSIRESMMNVSKSYAGLASSAEDARNRQVAPHRNWLAKLFHFKPTARYLCFCVSQRRARKELVVVFRDWKKYGMCDIQLDKARNIVFARVGQKNYLEIKEVSVAAEVLTVIEHGSRSQLSIVRFTQERGAASSFHKVIDTLEGVMFVKHMLVLDPVTSKRMVRTLEAASSS